MFFSALSLNVSAASSVTYRLNDFTIADGSQAFTSNGLNTFNGKKYSTFTWQTADNQLRAAFIYKLSSELKAGKNYTLTFDIIDGCLPKKDNVVYSRGAHMSFNLYLSTDISELAENGIPVCSFDTESGVTDYSIQFTYPDTLSGQQAYLVCYIIGFPAKNMAGNFVGSSMQTHVSDLVFTDNNDNSEEIDGILEWLSAVYHSIVGGEDSRGVQHDGLVQGIKNGLNSLGDRIGNFFNNLKESIEVKIDAIQQWFSDLGNDILEGLKKLFIPEEGYFDNYSEEFKTWADNHLGFIYSTVDVVSESVDVLLNMCLEHNGEFSLPEAEFTLNGTRYVLWDEYVIDMDDVFEVYPALEVIYKTYLTIVAAAFVFAILNYGNSVYCKFVQWGHD